jgi:diacylglycerol O-acyltransferase
MQQLSGLDASFLYFETANAPMHVGGLLIYDQSTAPGGAVRFKDILKFYEERMHRARSFRQKVVRVPLNLDHPYWVEDSDFDLEFHLRHIALPKPGDWRQLCIQVARLNSRALDHARPLWEAYVIEGLDNIPGLPKGSYAVLSKIHHAAIDGVSGAEMSAAVHDLEPVVDIVKAEREWKGEREPTSVELITRAHLNNLRKPFNLAKVMTQSVPALARVGAGLATRKLRPPRLPGQVPRTRFNGKVSPHRVFEGRRFDLAEIRAIKNSVENATVNDVVLTICGGALRKYLESKRELPDTSMVAMAPISVRSDDQRGHAGNQVSGMLVSLHTEIADPRARLIAVHDGTIHSKELTNAVGARLMTDYTQFIPSSTAGLAARLYTRWGLANAITPMFNCVITNVPGPQVPLYSVGARLVGHFGLGPILDGMGLIMPVFSYCGGISISITSCREMVPDPEFFAQCIQDSFDDVKRATLGLADAPVAKTVAKRAPRKPVAAHTKMAGAAD